MKKFRIFFNRLLISIPKSPQSLQFIVVEGAGAQVIRNNSFFAEAPFSATIPRTEKAYKNPVMSKNGTEATNVELDSA